jgi:hypothetical protein
MISSVRVFHHHLAAQAAYGHRGLQPMQASWLYYAALSQVSCGFFFFKIVNMASPLLLLLLLLF